MGEKEQVPIDALERVSIKLTRWVGSTSSLLIHTAFFIVSFVLYFFGFNMNTILLILTTAVSLEAIYLAIFIQMSLNRQHKRLKEVAEDIDEIQEDIDEIQEDVDEIQEDIEEDSEEDEEEEEILEKVENTLGKLIEEVIELKKEHKNSLKKDK